MNNDFIQTAHAQAVEWARGLLTRDPREWAILDTETTGLGYNDEIIQLAVIDGTGKVIIENQLVKPTCPISRGALAVHGVFPVTLDRAPSFAEIIPTLHNAVYGKTLVIYNSEFDTRVLLQSFLANGFNIIHAEMISRLGIRDVRCAMKVYAAWYGDWNNYNQSFRCQRLPSGDHSALGDCLSTLKLVRVMAEMDNGA